MAPLWFLANLDPPTIILSPPLVVTSEQGLTDSFSSTVGIQQYIWASDSEDVLLQFVTSGFSAIFYHYGNQFERSNIFS